MKQSIVWKCAITVAVAQVVNFVVLAGLAITSEIGPVYREWTGYTIEMLRGHHEVLAETVRKDGVQAARAAAQQLSMSELEHSVVVADPGWLTNEYMGMPGGEWSEFAEQADEPRRYQGRIRWISELNGQDSGKRDGVIILSSAQWPVGGAARNHPAGSAIWILGGLALSAIVGGFVATWFTKPILQLRTSITRFAAGELESRPDSRLQARRDEIGQLARDMADMESRIASLMNAQKDLLDHVAHELRSPLARINVAVELEEQKTKSDAADRSGETVDYLAKIRRESLRLSDMVDQLLQLSALEHRIDGISMSEISLTRIVREVAEDCGFEATAHGRRVVLDTDQSIQIYGNSELIRSAIENIVRNAVRYTPAGQTVEISILTATEKPDRALIVVRDHGPGVSEDALPKLFQPFFRIESDRSKEDGGAGLGLALADRAVRVHAGNIAARNHADGGLAVTIALPSYAAGG